MQSKQMAKKCLFSLQIRQRHREKIRKQIQLKYIKQSEIQKMFEDLPNSLAALSSRCTERKPEQQLITTMLVQLLRDDCRPILIQNCQDCYRWGVIVSSVFEYRPSDIQFVLQKVYERFQAFCESASDYQSIFILLSTAIKSLKTHFEAPPLMILFPHVQSAIQYLEKGIRNNSPVTINQLHFLTFTFLYLPKKLQKVAQRPQFYSRLSNHFDCNIDKIANIAQVIKILLIILYNDGEVYCGITHKLLDWDILEKLRYIIEFMNSDDSTCIQLQKETSHILINIAINVGAKKIVEAGFLHKLEHSVAEDSPIDLQLEYVKAYLVIVANVPNDSQNLEQIKQCNGLENVLFFIQRMGEMDQQVLINAQGALQNLFSIGEISRRQQSIKLNPCILHFDHLNGMSTLEKFPHNFHDLISRYGI